METQLKSDRRRVVLVQWKHHGQEGIEIYSNLKHFCERHPGYSYNTISNYLSKKKVPFEDQDIVITRKPVLNGDDLPALALPKRLFWEFDYDKIDWSYHYRMVIERVLQRGNEKDWQEIMRYYGRSKIIATLQNETSYLPDRIIEKVTSYFNLKPEQLKCYIRKQSTPKHWD
ncbi:DUF6922 domain-containing protein [Taibaiella helva]|uniref:DUF6922 domain-containing protein n=1 Tax=Taibaiella helva TaxID=2301235 RepID=UPI000E56D13D|nr:hypothetical protein [Taibaiella helva]